MYLQNFYSISPILLTNEQIEKETRKKAISYILFERSPQKKKRKKKFKETIWSGFTVQVKFADESSFYFE